MARHVPALAPGQARLSDRTTSAAPLEHGARAADAVHLRALTRPPTATHALSRPPTSAAAAAAFGVGGRAPSDAGALALAPPATAASPATAAPPLPGAPAPVKLGRRDGWIRFLAYEACWQVCLAAAGERDPHAAPFLADGCALLKDAFGFDGLLLKPVDDDATNPHLGSGASLAWDDSEPGPLPAVGFRPEVERRSVVKVVAGRLACSDLRGGDGGRRGTARGGASPLRGGAAAAAAATALGQPALLVRLRPSSWAVADAAVACVDGDGRAPGGDVLEVGPDDVDDDLIVDVVAAGDPAATVLATGVVPVADVWRAAGSCADDPGGVMGLDSPLGAGGGDDASRRRGLRALLGRAHAPAATDACVGKRWVTLVDPTGVRYGHLKLAARIGTAETTVIVEAPIRGSPAAAPAGGGRSVNSVTAWDVYDAVHAAARTAQACGPRRLTVEGEWAWLLTSFAAAYGVRDTYVALASAAWVVARGRATATAYCLDALAALLAPLEAAAAAASLLPAERALLAAVERDSVALLGASLEAYHSLAEDAPGGVLEGGGAAPVVPAPALLPAVELCGILAHALAPGDTAWLAARFRAAAVRRYAALETACDSAAPPFTAARADDGDEQAAASAYGRLEALASALRSELGNDLAIHDAAVLPACINLPQLAAAEYGALYGARLAAVLAAHPPPEPFVPVVDLLVAVGRQQEFLAYHNLLPPAGHPGSLDALAVFGPHVRAWIRGSRDALVARCAALEAATVATAAATGGAGGGGAGVAPVVDELLALAAGEVGRYERVVRYWPAFAPDVEGAVCAALRAATGAVSRQCGLTRVPAGRDAPTDDDDRDRAAHPRTMGARAREPGEAAATRGAPRVAARWKWSAPPPGGAAGLTVAPHEAVLLNSLRRLLVVAPQTERLLAAWAEGDDGRDPPSPRSRARSPSPDRAAALAAANGRVGPGAPALGAQLAQLVKELRCEYGGAVTAAAARLAAAVFRLPGRCVRAVLDEHGSSASPAAVAAGVAPALEALEEVLLGVARALDARASAALGRGLWDFTAAQVYDYVEVLQESAQEGATAAWRGRQAAAAVLDAVDKFFAAALAGVLGHALAPTDLDPPATAARVAALLADNTAAATAAYTVF